MINILTALLLNFTKSVVILAISIGIFNLKSRKNYIVVYVVTCNICINFANLGGADELMRAAGTDASLLFDENHRWINYKGMLKSCAIGPFIGDRKKCKSKRCNNA